MLNLKDEFHLTNNKMKYHIIFIKEGVLSEIPSEEIFHLRSLSGRSMESWNRKGNKQFLIRNIF